MGSCLSKPVDVDLPGSNKTSVDTPKKMETGENCSNFDQLETTEKEIQDDLTDTCSSETETDERDSDISGEEGSIKSLSPQQIEELAAARVKRVRNRISEVYTVENYDKATQNGHFPVTTRNLTDLVRESHYALDGVPLDRVTLFIKAIANMLIETKAIELICDIYKYYIVAGWTFEEDGVQQVDETKWTPFLNSTNILVNYSDTSDELALYIAKYPGLLDAIRYEMMKRKEAHLKGEQTEEAGEITEQNLTLSHNIAMRGANIPILRDLDFTSAVQLYLDSPIQEIRLIALATLASIVDEKECEIINANQGSVETFLLYLEKGLQNPSRRHSGWSCKEITYIVRMLARNDANKKMLSDLGALKNLVKVGQTGDEEEIYEVIHALWALAFDPDIRKMMVENDDIGLVELLQHPKASSHTLAIKKACSGVLWTIREELKSSTNEKYKRLGHLQERDLTNQSLKHKSKKKGTGKLGGQEDSEHRHIMISYQWADQKVIIQVRDRLKASGLKVWVDIDQMAGSTVQAMAEAVESADIFLMAMSHRYKDSPNCRAEAEYAFTKRKKIIPLKMESDYNADGWLGFILGSKLYYEFSGKFPFENKMGELLKEIKMFKEIIEDEIVEDQIIPTTVQKINMQPVDTVDSAPEFHPVTARAPVSKTSISKLRGWTQSDVQDWINKNDLNGCEVSKLTAGEVALLLTMRQEAPEFFYKRLQSMLHENDLLTMSKIVWALTDLVE